MFKTILDSVLNEASIAPITAKVNGFIASLGDVYPFILVALCLIVGLFGRRLSAVVRSLLLFAVGFVASVHWLLPLVQPYVPQLTGLVLGIAAGVLAFVLSGMIYNFAYIGVIAYGVYTVCYNATFLPELTVYTQGNLPATVAVVAVVVIIGLLLRKYLEMIITAAAGGVGVAYFVKMLFDYTASFNADPQTTMYVAGAVLAIPMFLYQYRNRVIF